MAGKNTHEIALAESLATASLSLKEAEKKIPSDSTMTCPKFVWSFELILNHHLALHEQCKDDWELFFLLFEHKVS